MQQPKTIAVLPLVDLSPGGGNDYIGDGLAQELSSRLARIPGLRVASQTSAFAYKGSHADIREIGRALGVRHVLEGSVQREGDHIRVTAELVDAASGITSGRRVTIATGRICSSSRTTCRTRSSARCRLCYPATWRSGSDSRPPRRSRPSISTSPVSRNCASPRLQRHSTRPKRCSTTRSPSTRASPRHTRACASATPSVTKAHATMRLQPRQKPPASRRSRSMPLCEKSKWDSRILYLVTGRAEQAAVLLHSVISKDPTDADAYIGLADAYEGQHETAEAEIAYGRAVEVEPSYAAAHTAFGNFLLEHGRAAAAVPHYKRVTELLPGSSEALNNLGAALLMSGDFQAAATDIQQLPEARADRSAYSNLGTVYYFMGRFQDAVPMYRKATELAPEDHRVWGNLADASSRWRRHAHRPCLFTGAPSRSRSAASP